MLQWQSNSEFETKTLIFYPHGWATRGLLCLYLSNQNCPDKAHLEKQAFHQLGKVSYIYLYLYIYLYIYKVKKFHVLPYSICFFRWRKFWIKCLYLTVQVICLFFYKLRPSSSNDTSVCLSVRLSVCLSISLLHLFHNASVIMKFSGIITNDRSDVHATGQGQRSKSQLAVSGL